MFKEVLKSLDDNFLFQKVEKGTRGLVILDLILTKRGILVHEMKLVRTLLGKWKATCESRQTSTFRTSCF